MNRTHLLTTSAAAFALALAAGCSGGNSSSKVIDNTESQAAGKTLALSIEDTAAALGPADQGPAAAPACASLSGDTSDPDGDHIPTDATITWTNCSQSGPGGTAVFNGTENAKDDDPNPAFAFTLAIDGTLVETASQGGATATAHRTGSIVGSQPGGAYQLVHDEQGTVDAQGGGQTYHAEEAYTLTTVYTPGSAWTPGQAPVAGTYAVSGTWSATVQGASANSNVQTPVSLSLDPACATHVVAGTVAATFDGPNATRTLTVTWNGCGSRTVTYTEQPN